MLRNTLWRLQIWVTLTALSEYFDATLTAAIGDPRSLRDGAGHDKSVVDSEGETLP